MRPSAWQTCATPHRMIGSLRGRATARKLRLFAYRCSAVEAAERHADRLLGESDLAEARRSAEAAAERAWGVWDDGTAQAQQAAAAGPDAEAAAGLACGYAAAAAQAVAGGGVASWKAEQRLQCAVLRDLFGDSPAPPTPPEAAWLAWAGGTAVAAARAIYEGRRFGELPLLADMLEDAGCIDPLILEHLRGPGPHDRGCWAVDLLLDMS